MQFATVQPITARPDHPVITDAEAAALARATVNLFHAWGLSDAEARVLLGDMAQRTCPRHRQDPDGTALDLCPRRTTVGRAGPTGRLVSLLR